MKRSKYLTDSLQVSYKYRPAFLQYLEQVRWPKEFNNFYSKITGGEGGSSQMFVFGAQGV